MNMQCLSVVVLLACAAAAQPAEATQRFAPAALYRAASGAVVMVYAEREADTFTTATGTLISEAGYILTNQHVVAPTAPGTTPTVYVSFKPATLSGNPEQDIQTAVAAQVLASDARIDLALLRVETPLPVHVVPLAFGNSDQVEIGQAVAAIGHPGGGGLWTLTTGTISNIQRDGDLDVFQTDTALNPGNSGGPLVDANGRLIGVNTYVVRLGPNDLPLEGLNFSLRSNFVKAWLSTLDVPILEAAQASNAVLESIEGDLAHGFRGPQGEPMYGVPDHDLDTKALSRSLKQRVSGKAEKAFEELDSLSH